MSAARGFERRYMQLFAGNTADDSYASVEIVARGEQESFALVRDRGVVVFGDMLREFGRGELTVAWYDPLARRDGSVALTKYLPPPGSGPDARSPDKPRLCWATLLTPAHRALLDPLRCVQAVISTDPTTGASVVAAPFPPSSVDVERWIDWCHFLSPAAGPLDVAQAVTDGAFTHGIR